MRWSAVFVVVFTAAASANSAVNESRVPEILVSRQLMQRGGLQVGDVVRLAVDPQASRSIEFRIAGEYEPMPNPMRFSARRLEIRLHLPDLQILTIDPSDPLSSESIGALNVTLTDPHDTRSVAADLTSRVPGIAVRSTSSATDEGDVFAVVDRFHWAIAVVTVVGSTAFLLALMVIRAEERRDVVGILRMIGVSPRSILVEVLLEGLLIAAAGAVFGIVVALLGQGAINRFFQWRYDTTLTFVRVTPRIAWESIALAVPLGVVAGLAVSWTLVRRHVVTLVRR